ncbi:MAG: DUF4340 domain-containing protein, partial [Akkermansiaceae bacterium]|nr:DUF4340 domain-containing protein [Akkermansiaceae bacterium]
MRSLVATTVLLVVLAAVFGSLAAVQIRDQDLSAVFGKPPLAKEDLLYDFDAGNIVRLNLTNSSGDRASFRKRGGRWLMEEPAEDRADYRHLEGLVDFARNLRIEDIIPARSTTPEECGFRAGHFDIELINTSGRRVARFALGRRTAWHRFDTRNNLLYETVFVRPGDEGSGDYVYVCSGPEVRRSLLEKGFGVLRDHRPFLFNPAQLASIAISSGTGELLLSRSTPEAGWRITKPLELRTDPAAVKSLLTTLTNLEAATVHDPGSVTTLDPDEPYLTVDLQVFNADGEAVPAAVLTVEPPATPEATSLLGKTAGRPAVFEFPLTPVNGRPTLSQLALSINDLRSKTLADLNIAALRTITLDATHLPRPLIVKLGTARTHGRPLWLVNYCPRESLANEL